MDIPAAIEAIDAFAVKAELLKSHLSSIRRKVGISDLNGAAADALEAAVVSSGMSLEIMKFANHLVGDPKCPSA